MTIALSYYESNIIIRIRIFEVHLSFFLPLLNEKICLSHYFLSIRKWSWINGFIFWLVCFHYNFGFIFFATNIVATPPSTLDWHLFNIFNIFRLFIFIRYLFDFKLLWDVDHIVEFAFITYIVLPIFTFCIWLFDISKQIDFLLNFF